MSGEEHKHHRTTDSCNDVEQKTECSFLQNALSKIEVAIDLTQKALAVNESLMKALNGTPTERGWLGRIENNERNIALLARVAIATCAVVCLDSIALIVHLFKG